MRTKGGKTRMRTRKTAAKREHHLNAWWVLPVHFSSTLVFSILNALTLYLGKWFHAVFMWALTPLFGAVAAYLATTRGLNNYIAWIVPPLTQTLGYLLIWNTLPQPGTVLVCALVTLFGAAAGQVRKTRGGK